MPDNDRWIRIKKNTFYLADQTVVETADSYSIAATVTAVIGRYEIHHQKVLAYTSDNALYMQKSFNSLAGIYPNCLYITCTAHLLDLVFEKVLCYNTDVESFINNWKAVFSAPGSRKERYTKFLTEKNIESLNVSKECPRHNTTRWLTWLRAIIWHGERIQYAKEFLLSKRMNFESSRIEHLIELMDASFEVKMQYLEKVSKKWNHL